MSHFEIEHRSPESHARQNHGERAQPRARAVEPDVLGYEDGLVHEHNWACRERGAEAHR